MGNKKLVVLFPGIHYSTDCPLLYYACFKFESRGYEKLAIDYGAILSQNKPSDENVKEVENNVLIKLKSINLPEYSDIVFVSKSLGTVIAGWVDDKLCIGARHIYLTPLKETLPFIHNKKRIINVIAGTKDKHLDIEILKEHCKNENINLKILDGAGHRLEVWGDMDKNIEILKEVVSLF